MDPSDKKRCFLISRAIARNSPKRVRKFKNSRKDQTCFRKRLSVYIRELISDIALLTDNSYFIELYVYESQATIASSGYLRTWPTGHRTILGGSTSELNMFYLNQHINSVGLCFSVSDPVFDYIIVSNQDRITCWSVLVTNVILYM